ncbi:virulence-associated E family protein [Terrisporobacter petrolearius]|uniref:virulence-associated E family protein n=1 Tax=Terrisporobacter petrolearius TaxID=1460447 RepID=UPI0022E2B9DF|nr:virulence-associated E family protein [Terrisporobacter petrolearius]
MKIDISIGKSRKDKIWKYEKINLEEFIKLISSTTRTSETMEQYRNLPKEKQDDIKDVGGFVLGKLKDNRRKKDCVISRSGLTLDMDYATVGIIDEIKMFFPFNSYFYSTHKHTKEKPRLRLIIPLSRNISPKEYCAVSRMIAKEIGIDLFDDTTYEGSRLMYWPSTSKDGEFIFEEIKGDLLNPDDVLHKYKDWTDSRQWPISSRQNIIVKHDVKKQADPLEKEGLVGAFCRAYSIEDVVEKFLSNIYEKSEMEGRYDYIPANSCAGVVVYDDKFAYSHHATDPACDKLVNAFDMVRIHKFGHLDENVDGNKECVNRPSYKAMEEFTVNDEKVKLQLAKERIELASLEFDVVEDLSEEEENKNWQELLELDKHGKVKGTLLNITNILRYDTNLKNIVYNELKFSIDVIGKLPWKQAKVGWSDADFACAKIYFENIYGIWSPSKFKDGLLGLVWSERTYHPIKEYFSKLTWDGKKRIDTLLIDYLGAKDSKFVRAVTRKTLCAAVARIYKPGIKFDNILVLNGPQGIGKSTLFSILGKEWYSDSLSLTDMKDKTAAEKLQGYWILELGELAGMKKVEMETIKSFVTRTDDKFRQAYGITVENHPRSNIIVGTTNAESGFLRDITGNRRFWPVNVSGISMYKPWDLKEVDQIWAEAIDAYKDGEELFLKGEVAAMAYDAQKDALECDDREGIISEYLERLLPDDWNKMDLYERRSFLSESDLSFKKGTTKREKVCIMEIWCECFYKERQDLKRADSYAIESIINRIGGWERLSSNRTGKTRYPLYGPQITFIRNNK